MYSVKPDESIKMQIGGKLLQFIFYGDSYNSSNHFSKLIF